MLRPNARYVIPEQADLRLHPLRRFRSVVRSFVYRRKAQGIRSGAGLALRP
jgi:hypothetical protein